VTARAPGVGLSLAISRSLLEQMGGMLMLQSQPGAGSAFTIRLPAIVTTAS
jgi:two-component system, NarL family, sensor histidine kinase EvgS